MALGEISKGILSDRGVDVSDVPSPAPAATPAPATAATQQVGGGGLPAEEFVETQVKEEVVNPEPGLVIINDNSVQPEPAPAAPAPAAEVELDDEALLKAISKKFGRDISSLDELNQPAPIKEPTEEEKQQAAERLRDEAIAYGINNKFFNRKDLEAYATDKAKTPRETALAIFSQNMKTRIPGITDEEIQDRFSEWAFEGEDDDSPLRQMKLDEMQQMHDNYLGQKYSAIQQIDQVYNEDQQLLSEGARYSATVNKIFNAMTDGTKPYEMKFSVGDLGEYGYEVSPAVINEIKQKYLTADTFRALGANANNEQVLAEIVNNAIKAKEFNNILHRVSEAHKAKALLEEAAKRQGVVPQRQIESETASVQKPLGQYAEAILANHQGN